MADKSREGTEGHTQWELRWFRRKQIEEVRNNLEKLNELVVEEKSRTLIQYLMASTEKVIEEISKTNQDLILQMNEREGLLGMVWLKRFRLKFLTK